MSTISPLITSEAMWRSFRETISANPQARADLATMADPWLSAEPFSVVDKKQPAPSGDLHDYVSMGPYWWPDPAKADGLPWIRRDGEVNPLTLGYDKTMMEAMSGAVIQLILQACATGSEAHARTAGKFLRTWFLDENTRMNPHLRFGQSIPGICEGRGIGIIDTTALVFLLDAVPHLEFNDAWMPDDLDELKAWFTAYLDWLLHSDLGRAEADEFNNHGTWYDAQVACFANFCDKPELAARQIETRTKERIASQIEPDGRQPHELARTLSFSYSTYNLLAFACLARMAGNAGLDLWHWESPAGSSIAAAVRWMLPYYSGEQKWTHQQLKSPDMTSVVHLLNLASETIDDDCLIDTAERLERHPWERMSFFKADLIPKKG